MIFGKLRFDIMSVYSDNRRDTLIQMMKKLFSQLVLIKRSNTAADILSERTLLRLQFAG